MLRKQTYFTSDLHLGHGNIIRYCRRPFLAEADLEVFDRYFENGQWIADPPSSIRHRFSTDAIASMDDTLIEAINSTVRPEDTLWHLGDFAFSTRKSNYEAACRRYRDRINCRDIRFVFGNHDQRSTIRKVFEYTYDLAETEINGVPTVLCHYAMAIWNRSHHNAFHLYGHSHSAAEAMLDEAFPNRRSIDVGVDNAYRILGEYRPFSTDELLERLNR